MRIWLVVETVVRFGARDRPPFPVGARRLRLGVAEAMAAGLPVIASDIDSLRETTGGNAVHMSADHPDAFAAAIEGLLEASQRLQELSETGAVAGQPNTAGSPMFKCCGASTAS